MKKLIGFAVALMVIGSFGSAGAVTIDLVSAAGIASWGPLDHYADPTSSDWGTQGVAVATWEHPSWPTLSPADWVSTSYTVEDPVIDSWRRFQTSFFIDGTILPGSSITIATSDNAESVFLNNVLVGSDGEVTGAFVDNSEWNTLLTYSFTPVAGLNTLDFIVRNYAMPGGTVTTNPTGLLFQASVTYEPNPVPEPSTMLLLGSGLLGLVGLNRRRRA